MEFGKILSRSSNIIWKHKVLWIFGILASCGAQNGGSGGGGGGGTNFSTQTGPDNLPPELAQFFAAVERSLNRITEEQLLLYGLLFAAALVLLVVLAWLVGLYGKTGLTVGALRAEAGSEVSFRPIWTEAWGYFGRVVGLNFVLGLLPLLLGILLVAVGIFLGALTLGFGLLCLIPVICLLVPVFIAYYVYMDIANVAIVKERLGMSAAIRRAWEVFRANLGNIALLALILIIGGFIVNLLLSLPFFLAFIPFFVSAMRGGEGFAQSIRLFLICIVISLPFLILFGGILQSYLQTAWTLAYSELTGAAKPAPKPRKTAAKSK